MPSKYISYVVDVSKLIALFVCKFGLFDNWIIVYVIVSLNKYVNCAV